jgi:multidrug resistance efflux pump
MSAPYFYAMTILSKPFVVTRNKCIAPKERRVERFLPAAALAAVSCSNEPMSTYAAENSTVPSFADMNRALKLDETDAAIVKSALAEWKRAQELFAGKLISQVDYDTDKANYEVAKANVAVSEHRKLRIVGPHDRSQERLVLAKTRNAFESLLDGLGLLQYRR